MKIILLQQKVKRMRPYQGACRGLLAKAKALTLIRKISEFTDYTFYRYVILFTAFFFFILLAVFLIQPSTNIPSVISELSAVLPEEEPTGAGDITASDNPTVLLPLSLPEVGLMEMIYSGNNISAAPDIKKKVPARTKKTDNPESNKASFPEEINISFYNKSDGDFVSTHLLLASEIPAARLNYIWDLGDGRKSCERKLAYTYSQPGNYQVQLTVSNEHGVKTKSNVLNIKIPPVQEQKSFRPDFFTLNKITDVFYTNKKVLRVEDSLNQSEKPVKLVGEENGKYCYQALLSGFFSLVFADGADGEASETGYLFVSPFDSIHSDRSDCNWYRTQFNTGLSNCGPATASMGIGWASGEYVDVKEVRKFIGWQGNGGTSFDDLQRTLAHHGVKSLYTDVKDRENLFTIIDRGNIAIILYQCGAIPMTKSGPEYDLVGRYYADSVGHYIIVKGYSTDRKYFIVYDPIPSDWSCNGKRYGDGVSMLGRNRYYPASLLMKSILTNYVIEITR